MFKFEVMQAESTVCLLADAAVLIQLASPSVVDFKDKMTVREIKQVNSPLDHSFLVGVLVMTHKTEMAYLA